MFKRQIIGPHVPEDWFTDLDNEPKDFLPTIVFKPWLSSDLTNPLEEPNHVHGYAQVPIAGIMMVDKNAVAALQNARQRQLLSCGAFTVESLMLPGTPFPRERVFGDVYVEDLAAVAVVETPDRAFAEDRCRSRNLLGMAISRGPLGVAHLDGQRGTLGFPTCRRATLALTTCLGARLVVTTAQLKRVLDAWATGVSLLPRRQLRWRRKPPSRKPCKLSGAVLNELVLVR